MVWKRCCLFLILITRVKASLSSSPNASPSSIILRIRKVDGSIGRVVVPQDAKDSTSLESVISSLLSVDESSSSENINSNDVKCQIGDDENVDMKQSISSLGLKHGSLVTMVATKKPILQSSTESEMPTKNKIQRYTTFDPFPDIAKVSSYSDAARRTKALARLPSKRGSSYSELSNLQSNMHVIEPQSKGPIQRIYMCHTSAQRFKDSCTILPTKKQLKATGGKMKPRMQNRCAVLFGTIQSERVDQSNKVKARTSLSTPLYEMERCDVVKVHAIWEPPQEQPLDCGPYDASNLWGIRENDRIFDDGDEMSNDSEFQRALKIAEALGMQLCGWIYSYTEDRLGNDPQQDKTTKSGEQDALPVFGRDIVVGALGQIQKMKKSGRDVGSKFITLALDARTGATEAFQLSDVSVQMVAEGVISPFSQLKPLQNSDANQFAKRFFKTADPVIIDTKETHTVDSVLCLINTALLSHQGKFVKDGSLPVKKGGGGLTPKTKQSLTSILQEDNNDESLLSKLCDFNILIALSKLIEEKDMDDICKLVTKFSNGQRKGTSVNQHLKHVLISVLGP